MTVTQNSNSTKRRLVWLETAEAVEAITIVEDTIMVEVTAAATVEATKGVATAEATKVATNIEAVKVEVMAVVVTAGAVIIIKVATTDSTEDSHATAITATEAVEDVVVTTMVNVDNEPEVKAAEEIG